MDVSLIASVGIDLGKTTFHLVALDCHDKVILRKKCSLARSCWPTQLICRGQSSGWKPARARISLPPSCAIKDMR